MVQSKESPRWPKQKWGMLFVLTTISLMIALWLVGCPTESPESPDLIPSFDTETIAPVNATVGIAVSRQLPPAGGGDETLGYSLEPTAAMPAGLTFAPDDRTISGTSTVPTDAAGVMLTYRATDADGDTASLPVTIIVGSTPTFGTQTIADMVFVMGVNAAPTTLPAATGGNRPLDYTLTEEGATRPSWINFDDNNRTLTITTDMVRTADLTYEVTDGDGDGDSLDFTIGVEADSMPTFAIMAIDPQIYPAGLTIPQWTLPTATGGNGTLTYNIVGTIPVGLTTVPTDLSGGSSAPIAIGGTPTTAAAETTLTYEVRDADNDIATLALSITIIAAADGSAANPYLVSTTEELRSIALGFRSADPANGAIVSGVTAETTEISLPLTQSLAAHYRQTGNITLCDDPTATNACTAFIPIGIDAIDGETESQFDISSDVSNTTMNDQPFTGSYDGAEHDISGLRVEIDSTIRSYGLFGMINGSGVVLRNIRLQNPNVTGQRFVGGMAGVILGGNIMNCAVMGGSVTDDTGSDAIGGLIGGMDGGGMIEGSYATSRVGGGASGDSVGGLIGYIASASVVRNSYASGAVDGGTGNDQVGGLVGQNLGTTIENSYASGSVTGDTGRDQVGGLLGLTRTSNNILMAPVVNSYATGNVDGGADNDSVGGLVGTSLGGTIDNSYATGSVDGGADNDDVGGLLSANPILNATVTASYYSGTITGETSNTTNDGTARTPAQLQCPMAPTAGCDGAGGTLAGGATTYAGWSTDNWDFGTVNNRPKVLVVGTAIDEVGGQ